MEDTFKPKIIVFCCNWCSYAGADLAGISRLQIKPHFRVIRTMCSARVDPEWILEALRLGADGVIVAGCHPGDCHYIGGNYRTRRRVALLRSLLKQFGLNPQRLELAWISAGEAERFATTINGFIDRIIELGPSPYRKERDNLQAESAAKEVVDV
ncbi:MAG: hydrogenase iron-sulfur subunit [Planctomycetota bacterium]|jgi:coenzyme F420-reducing hydrogenase delta subunit